MEPIHTEYYKGFTINIIPDEDPENPRTAWDNLGKMLCFHSRYTLGDQHDLRHSDFANWGAVREYLIKEFHAEVMLPLYLYDHSGITIKTSPFSCGWDSGQVGWIYATRDDIAKWFGVKTVDAAVLKRAEKALESEVVVYDEYLVGNVYGYDIKDAEGEDLSYEKYGITSCWGYYGGYREKGGVLDEAKALVDGFAKEDLKNSKELVVKRTYPEL